MKNDIKPTPVTQAPVATTQTSAEVAPQEPPEQNPLLSFLPLVLVFVVFYFFILKPQQKRQKAEKALRESVKVGDRVVLSSGIFGVVREIDEQKGVLSLEIAKNTNILVYKTSVSEVLIKSDII